MDLTSAVAAVLTGFGEAPEIHEIQLSSPTAGEVVVDVHSSGVCHSDRSAQMGSSPRARDLPMVLGHEVAGTVAAIGPGVSAAAVGDHVVLCAAASCGNCRACCGGREELCTSMERSRPVGEPSRLSYRNGPLFAFVGVGGFATRVLVHEQALVPIPKTMPLGVAAVLGCGVHTGIGAVRHSASVSERDSVVVIGCGGVGLNAIQGARLSGARTIIAIDIDPARLALAGSFGATLGVLSGEDALAVVHDATDGGADHVLDVVGQPATMLQALAMAAPGGSVTIVGLPEPGTGLLVDDVALFAGKRVQGHRMGRHFRTDIPWYCERYLAGDLLLDELVSQWVPLGNVNAALSGMSATMGRSILAL